MGSTVSVARWEGHRGHFRRAFFLPVLGGTEEGRGGGEERGGAGGRRERGKKRRNAA